MQPHHHIHVSTGFLFVFGLIVVALVAIVLWARASGRKAKREHELELARLKVLADQGMHMPQSSEPYRRPGMSNASTSGYAQRSSAPPAPTAAPVQPVYQNNNNDGFLTGLVVGDLIGSAGRSETIVEEDRGGYSDPAPYSDSGSSSTDSGFDSGSSDSGSSGGLDVSW